MPLPRDKAWFPTKTYGYGWGVPQRWQGWVVLLVFFGALVFGVWFTSARPVYFVAYALALSLGLMLVCWAKGEAPRWRWGGLDEPPASGKNGPDHP